MSHMHRRVKHAIRRTPITLFFQAASWNSSYPNYGKPCVFLDHLICSGTPPGSRMVTKKKSVKGFGSLNRAMGSILL